MRILECLSVCAVGTVGCTAVLIGVVFCTLVALFDLLCMFSLFYGRDAYIKCPHSDLILYVTLYLLVPYMIFGKHKIVKVIVKTASGEEKSTDKIEKKPNGGALLLEWIWYAFMFYWGINEFNVSCVHKLKGNMVYPLAFTIMILSGIVCIAQLFLFCCGVATGSIRQNNQINDGYVEYRRVQQSDTV